MRRDATPAFRVHTFAGVLAKTVSFPADGRAPAPIARHAHDDYQINLSVSNPGRYVYRGDSFVLPPNAMAILHPGEAHAVQNMRDPRAPALTRLLYVPRTVVQTLTTTDAVVPFVRVPLIDHAETLDRFTRLHRAISSPVTHMERDTFLVEALEALFSRFALREICRVAPQSRREISRAREYLHAHMVDDVTLSELAGIAGLSGAHFLRLFRAQVGTPPHAYQLQLRLRAAKRLLLTRLPIAQIALDLGFAHHSHFTARFKNVEGVTPTVYRAEHFLDRREVGRYVESRGRRQASRR